MERISTPTSAKNKYLIASKMITDIWYSKKRKNML